MNVVWRRIQRSSKKAAKYRFTITPQELLVVSSSNWTPNSVVIACMHRRRRVEGRERKWESSFADPCRGLVVWPAQAADPLVVDTTLYGDFATHDFEDKDWTMLVEEVTPKGKHRPLAAVSLNMRLFIQTSPESKSELKLKLRPLWNDVAQCSMQILIASTFIGEQETGDGDTRSETSSVQGVAGLISERDATESDVRAVDVVDASAVASISAVSNDIQKWNRSEAEDSAMKQRGPSEQNRRAEAEQSAAKAPPPLSTAAAADRSVGADAAAPQKPTSPSEEKKAPSAVHPPWRTTVARRDEKFSLNENGVLITKKVEAVSKSPVKPSSATESAAGNDAMTASAVKVEDSLKVPLANPEVIEGEDLLAWCQRVARGYPSVKITDLTKSFRSGLAFCALIHRYRPQLIGEFSKLDFSDSHSGRRENCRRALAAAATLGVRRKLDAGMTVTLPDRQEVCSFLSELRPTLEGVPLEKQLLSKRDSDHRISALFNLSESENSVMQELENLRRNREQKEAIDLTDVPDEDKTKFAAVAVGSTRAVIPLTPRKDGSLSKVRPTAKENSLSARRPVDPFDSDSDLETDATNKNAAKCVAVGLLPPPSGNVEARPLNGVKSPGGAADIGLVSPTVTARHEQLLKKRRQILDDPSLDVSSSPFDSERSRRLRDEARRLMEHAALEGTTVVLSGGSAPVTTHQSPAVASTSSLQRNTSLRSTGSAGSKGELRCLEVVTPSVSIYNFKKVQPSPVLQRKQYESPIIPAFERPSQRLSTSHSDIRTDGYTSTTFDRVKRYGSMRGQELAETVAKMAGFTQMPFSFPTNAVEATPTRKIVTQWEKDSSDVSKIQSEQSRLSCRLAEVSAEDEQICSLLKRTAASSDEEERLLREHMRLLTEKDALVRKSEYFNVLGLLSDVNEQIVALQAKLSSASSIEQANKTEEDKQQIDRMMDELVDLVNQKDQLSQRLIHHEAEDEEIDERDRMTLEAAANFSRGSEQPISASKRLITWFRSEISS